MLGKLKTNGNKYYQFYEDYNVYQARCKASDPAGYDVVFNDKTDNVQGDVEMMSSNVKGDIEDEIDKDTLDSDDDNLEENDDIEYETKDRVKKYQFEYKNPYAWQTSILRYPLMKPTL